MIIEFSKKHNKVMTPTRSNPSDAGLDVYADLKEATTIKPGNNTMIPTGLKFGIPHGYMLQVCNRSGMGAKRSLVVGAHVVDSGYDGEVFIDIHNIGSAPQTIFARDKIAQLVMVPVVHFRANETQGDLYSSGIAISGRGDGSLGSTDAVYGDGSCMKGVAPKEDLPHPLDGMPPGF
tara:strand:- start:419 stop:949 length:531 start_codon:yes stop_codon:yes gene_type:complete